MSAVWYTGRASKRTISVEDWDGAGITVTQDTVWDASNGFSIPQASFTAAQIAILDADYSFRTGAPDGPRTGPLPPATPRSKTTAMLSDLDKLETGLN